MKPRRARTDAPNDAPRGHDERIRTCARSSSSVRYVITSCPRLTWSPAAFCAAFCAPRAAAAPTAAPPGAASAALRRLPAPPRSAQAAKLLLRQRRRRRGVLACSPASRVCATAGRAAAPASARATTGAAARRLRARRGASQRGATLGLVTQHGARGRAARRTAHQQPLIRLPYLLEAAGRVGRPRHVRVVPVRRSAAHASASDGAAGTHQPCGARA